MTKPRYASEGCAAGSQVRERTPLSGYAWFVSFNNGNSNNDHHDNDNFVRAVRASEYQHAVSFDDLYRAWRRARRNKQPSANQLAFEERWADGLLALQEQLNAGTWQPRPTTCFIAKRPKAREIHAPDFSDRIVHHWLVPQLEAIWEPKFAYDSFSNRPGKGTHAAVDRLRDFMREVRSGQGGGWYLQLDIKNFFNTIHRPTLWAMLKRGMAKAGTPVVTQRAVHALLRRSPLSQGVEHRSTPAEHARVPAHKRLANAAPGRGLPIGNLSSQFFANVYLDALDQFVKHKLKAPRYLRYVDDFIIVHESREQLQAWLVEIERFLRETLRLELKADVRLKPLAAGADFLGYQVYATHRLIRRRVIGHAIERLRAWERRHVNGAIARATPEQFRLGRSIWASYLGHFSHGNARRLTERFYKRFAWLAPLSNGRRRFDYRLEGRPVSIRINEAP
jgi:RNA-directed DNA polymerase